MVEIAEHALNGATGDAAPDGGRARLVINGAPVNVGAVDREPDPEQVGYFDDAVRDAVLLRREMELGS